MTYNETEVMEMPDYKEMYLTMVRETEKAIRILIDVQKRCEEMAISSEDALLHPFAGRWDCTGHKKSRKVGEMIDRRRVVL